MKKSRITIRTVAGFALALSGLLSWAMWFARASSATARPARSAAPVSTRAAAGEAEKKSLLARFAGMPLQFVENRGQVDSRVAFYVQGRDTTLYFTPQGITYALGGETTAQSSREAFQAPPLFGADDFSRTSITSQARRHWVLKLDFVNANPHVQLKGQDPTAAVTSYFLGPRDQWRTGLASYATLVYENLWPGIDLVYSGGANRLKYQFVVKPGADPTRIKLAYRGASSVSLNAQGQLAVTTPVGEFHDDTPYSYQEIGGQRLEIKTGYSLDAKARSGRQSYGFRVDGYDNSKSLVIDPAILLYAGYIGGAGDERALGIAVDSVGNAYVTGTTSSSQATFPVDAGADMTLDGVRDAFIVKVNATGAGIVYATYIGGAGDDVGLDIAVDGAGNAYVTGMTSSTQNSFPVTAGPDLSHNGGSYDAFVAKLNAAGTALAYCGYIGGSGEDGGTAIAVDGGGNAYITGGTSSSEATFPVSIGPDLTYNGGLVFGDAFVAKVNAAGAALAYCGYIGGSGEDAGLGIAVDSGGNAYIAGGTTSFQTTFPVAVGPDLTYNGGVRDGFVAKVNTAGTALVYAGYIGGASGDTALGIAVDAAGNAYVTGDTGSTETSFPVAFGPDLTYNDGGDAFIAKINPAGNVFVFCGYIGGAGRDGGTDVRVDSGGNAYVTGTTASNEATFPVSVGPALNYSGGGFNGDAFVAKVKATGLTLDYCGYLGGSSDDIANALALDSNGNAYIAGETTSTQATFPATVGPDLTYNGGVRDAFVARVGSGATPTTVQFSSAAYNVNEGCVTATITVNRVGDTGATVSVDYATGDGTAPQRTDYTIGAGTVTLNSGVTSQTFPVLISKDAYTEGSETINLSLSNSTGGATLGTLSTATLTIIDDATVPTNTQPIDDGQTFVGQHYHDFLAREADAGGAAYWSSQIAQCGTDPVCIRNKRIDVSNAFFFEQEFQETGAYVYRVYKAAMGQRPSYAQFMPDRSRVIGGPQLDQSKTGFANAFVQRRAFIAVYPNSMTAAEYVDGLNANTGSSLTQGQRDALAAGLATGMETRGSVLRQVADNSAFIDREYNASFVLTQYFGYLRRDLDQGGFDFWLSQVNRFPIRNVAIQQAMVCSFITSSEYQERFGSVVSHSNQECPQ